MPLLYRSPNICVDRHEWHVAIVQTNAGRVVTKHLWRPLGPPLVMWSPISAWCGPLPKGLARFFAPYTRSIRVARGDSPSGTQTIGIRRPRRRAA